MQGIEITGRLFDSPCVITYMNLYPNEGITMENFIILSIPRGKNGEFVSKSLSGILNNSS